MSIERRRVSEVVRSGDMKLVSDMMGTLSDWREMVRVGEGLRSGGSPGGDRSGMTLWSRLPAFSHHHLFMCVVRPIVVLSAMRAGRESTLCASPVPCGGDRVMADALQVVLSSRDGTVRVTVVGSVADGSLLDRVRAAQRVLASPRVASVFFGVLVRHAPCETCSMRLAGRNDATYIVNYKN